MRDTSSPPIVMCFMVYGSWLRQFNVASVGVAGRDCLLDSPNFLLKTTHRRSSPTEPLHCVYGLGLGDIAQGSKQVLLRDEVINCVPGQSMLTTIDSPVVAHVVMASQREPFLGMFLTLDIRLVSQLVSDMESSPHRLERAYRSISVETSDAALVDALLRLLELLGEPVLVHSLAPLIQQEITIRLLAGPHGAHLQDLVAAGSPRQQIANTVVCSASRPSGMSGACDCPESSCADQAVPYQGRISNRCRCSLVFIIFSADRIPWPTDPKRTSIVSLPRPKKRRFDQAKLGYSLRR